MLHTQDQDFEMVCALLSSVWLLMQIHKMMAFKKQNTLSSETSSEPIPKTKTYFGQDKLDYIHQVSEQAKDVL